MAKKSGGKGKGIEWTDERLFKRVAKANPQKVGSAIFIAAKAAQPVVTRDMRSEARWTDRTSNARNGLISKAYSEPKRVILALAHRVPYGIWLEVRWSGKYAIVIPMLPRAHALIMKNCKTIFKEVFPK